MRSFLAVSLIGLLVTARLDSADAQVLKREPPMGQVKPGQRLLIDDGSCPSGQIKEIIGGDYFYPDGRKKESGVLRQRRCISRHS